MRCDEYFRLSHADWHAASPHGDWVKKWHWPWNGQCCWLFVARLLGWSGSPSPWNTKQRTRNRTEIQTLNLDCFFYHVVISTKNILQHWIEDVCSSDWFAWFNACMLYMFPFSEQCPAAIWRANPHKILSLALMGWSLDQRDHGLHAGSAVYCLANVTSLMTSQKSPKVTQLWYIQTTYPNNIS